MKTFLITLLFALTGMGCLQPTTGQTPVDYVNMMIGTDGAHHTEYGGIVPSVTQPFGMTSWCAVTRTNKISRTMYHHQDQTLQGFMASHQPCIWMGDYGFMTLMPEINTLKMDSEARKVPLDRKQETATPYYYKVTYAGDKQHSITTEFTATSRASFFRIHYPKTEKAILYLEAGREEDGGGIEIFPDRKEIHIFNRQIHNSQKGVSKIAPKVPLFKGYYVLKYDAEIVDYGTYQDEAINLKGASAEGSHVGGYLVFAEGTADVNLRIGSSFISYEQAQYNLNQEIPASSSFDETKEKVKASWNHYLSKVKLEGASADDLQIFYTALFHTLQFPRETSEYGKYFSAFDSKVHQGVAYNDYSLWDTFRAEHPWIQLIAPERVNGMIQSLVQMYQQGGWLPKWPNPTYSNIMIGTHADAVIADAYVNGFRGYDLKEAYAAIRKDAYTPPARDEEFRWGDRAQWNGHYEARGGLTNYLKKGYVSEEKANESVSRTLEFALDDYCIAQMAKGMGHRQDYKDLMKRAKNYIHLYNPETGFFQARNLDGSWVDAEKGMTEGAKWTYQFCVMQDVEGLIQLMGGKEAFLQKLDRNFDEKHYRHDNEPGHHYVYLYNYCNELGKTQERIPGILAANYKNRPDGLSGNDDCGQMSAWYLFTCLGFYPVTPASGVYALGIPNFDKATIVLPNNKTLTISAKNRKQYTTLTDVRFNGKKLSTPFIRIKDLWKGGVLEFLHR